MADVSHYPVQSLLSDIHVMFRYHKEPSSHCNGKINNILFRFESFLLSRPVSLQHMRLMVSIDISMTMDDSKNTVWYSSFFTYEFMYAFRLFISSFVRLDKQLFLCAIEFIHKRYCRSTEAEEKV